MRLSYEVVGEGRPLVFLHGWRLDRTVERRDFEPVLSETAGWKRVYVDLPGMGETPADKGLRSLEDFAHVVEEFIFSVLRLDRLAVAGTSAGALIARHVAQLHPSAVQGLLLRVPLVEPNSSARQLPSDGLSRLPARDRHAAQAKYAHIVRPAQQRANPRFLDPIRRDPTRYARAFDEDDENFARPALIIVGRQDTQVGFEDAWRLVERFPRSTFCALDLADHNLPWQRSALFDALVVDWLDRVAAEWTADEPKRPVHTPEHL